MICIILALLIAVLVFCIRQMSKNIIYAKGDNSHSRWTYSDYFDIVVCWGLAAGIMAMVVLGVGGVAVGFVNKAVNLHVIDEKISLYETRNNEINTALAEMIEAYTNYETQAFADAKLDNATVVLQAYPDLQAQPLVQQQIETYVENEKEIIRLKEEKINAYSTWWWLSFGIGHHAR